MSSVGPLVLFFGGSPSPGEILIILAIVLVLFGAKRLPEIARTLGRSMEAFRRAARDNTAEIVHADTDTGTEKKEDPSDLPPPDTVASGSEESKPEPSGPTVSEEERDDGAA